MLNDSVSSSSIDNPLPVDETSAEIEIVLSIITGRAQEVLNRVKTWTQARTLYRIADKYQLDAHRPWFSQICRNNASEEPWEAIFLATNQHPMDKDLIRAAITEGFEERGFEEICNSAYFTNLKTDPSGEVCWRTLRTHNTTNAFGVRLGFSGLLAYNLTFGMVTDGTGTEGCELHFWADKFLENVEAIESQLSLSPPAILPSGKGIEDRDATSVSLSKLEIGESTRNNGAASTKTSKVFNCPSGNILIRTVDNVIFRIQDYHLQAASGPLGEMTKKCGGATSNDKPLLVDVHSTDLEILLSIITGRGLEVIDDAEDWEHAQYLFSLMVLYRLNNFHPWFSQICRARSTEEPWEAIFLACNQCLFDKDLIMAAMVKGFESKSFSTICNPIYYEETKKTEAGAECWTTLTAVNTKPLLGLRLGPSGVLAYHTTFWAVDPLTGTDTISWHNWAATFVRNMRDIEAQQKELTAEGETAA